MSGRGVFLRLHDRFRAPPNAARGKGRVGPAFGRKALSKGSYNVPSLRTDRQSRSGWQSSYYFNRKTKTRFLPNLCNVTLISDALKRSVCLRASAHALRSVEHRGGLDAFLAKAREIELSQRARELKREIAKKQVAAA